MNNFVDNINLFEKWWNEPELNVFSIYQTDDWLIRSKIERIKFPKYWKYLFIIPINYPYNHRYK
jgi:hypothetical protein